MTIKSGKHAGYARRSEECATRCLRGDRTLLLILILYNGLATFTAMHGPTSLSLPGVRLLVNKDAKQYLYN
ncbi:hypothetical protein RvY_00305 [Ramazzottius varieornatus]|uniref:Uncharacterized protein n=1 Tax=Ramazzottius varieornatus TaxID=947166 RepID=A0A1D1UG02_RAMVA|nr:hypothetical protein RvY_00305 [Ramazzottius varieornatus]